MFRLSRGNVDTTSCTDQDYLTPRPVYDRTCALADLHLHRPGHQRTARTATPWQPGSCQRGACLLSIRAKSGRIRSASRLCSPSVSMSVSLLASFQPSHPRWLGSLVGWGAVRPAKLRASQSVMSRCRSGTHDGRHQTLSTGKCGRAIKS